MKRESRVEGETPITVELECLSCHARSSVELSSEKFKALSAAWKIARGCDKCGKSTDWSFAEAKVETEEQADFWDWLATTGEYFEPPKAAPQDERRKEPRIEMRVPLRISNALGEAEEVTSENISKSGFCFASAKTYRLGESIQATLQPAGAIPAQTKTATIVRVNPPAKGKALYGARIEK